MVLVYFSKCKPIEKENSWGVCDDPLVCLEFYTKLISLKSCIHGSIQIFLQTRHEYAKVQLAYKAQARTIAGQNGTNTLLYHIICFIVSYVAITAQ